MSRRIYLDNAGAGVASPQQLEAYSRSLTTLSLSNPHSRHSTAQQTFALVENARSKILKFLHTSSEDYCVVFTHNTTHSLKIVAESFQYNSASLNTVMGTLADLANGKSTLLMLNDSHTSVLGMRQIKNYEQCIFTDFESLSKFLDSNPPIKETECRSLFVLTAMSNFSGTKYNLDVIDQIKQVLGQNWSVCLDSAAWVPCSPLDLSIYKADFVAFSFYKLFGFPTGVGALLIRKGQENVLQKQYFGGGTVETVFPNKFDVFYKQSVEHRFEDGTLNFHSIAALRHGFDDLERLGGMIEIEKHCLSLAKNLHGYLSNRKHENGTPIAKIYGNGWNSENLHKTQGDIVNFNLLRDDGSFVGFVEVEKMCDLFGIELRTGCHCNQGACSSYLELDDQMLTTFREMGKTCHDEIDLVDGKPLGTVRISFGRLNTIEDVETVKQMIECCFVDRRFKKPIDFVSANKLKDGAHLSQMFVYPIKSGGSLSPRKWQLSKSGLRWDRNWMITGAEGLALNTETLSSFPEVSSHYLIVKDRRDIENTLQLRLNVDFSKDEQKAESSRICVNNVETFDCGEGASNWLQNFDLPTGSRLVRLISFETADRSFSNQADYLLLSRASVEFLAEQTGLDYQICRLKRTNLKVFTLEVTGKCTRCQMICVDQETGQKDPNVLLALRDIRAGNKMTFGVYLTQESDRPIFTDIVVGSFVYIERRKAY
ncbi:Molybdenum cofactor sulfurase [Aphelenchoides bicaudatus]|nr:Molybdenum cofactor sulfurase [Aphelenchoides bicaudatus]